MLPRILIVGTVPYNKKATSRAFEAYFSKWDREKLAQIFSNTKTPVKGHCQELFQITDQRMVQRRFHHSLQTGIIYHYEDLPEEWTDNSREIEGGLYKKLYQFSAHKGPLTYLLRKIAWSRRYWCTPELNAWLDRFSPQCVFLSFSDDFFIPEIALYVAERYNIPIVSSIGDDYYFNDRFSLSPFYYLYRTAYKKLIRKVFAHGGSAIYISDKIRDKYNAEFHLYGKTVYLTSEVQRKPFRPIAKDHPVISYFGNIRQGRNESLCQIADALSRISDAFVLDVYTNQESSRDIDILMKNSNIRFHGSIPYSEVLKKTEESDIVVIVEGFQFSHIQNTRYSLSTKAADSLASGAQILVYGSPECGVIEYMAGTNSAAVCTEKEKLEECIRHLIEDEQFQKENYLHAIEITERNHSLSSSTHIFSQVVEEAIAQYANRKQF